jgi:hypothetical protein
MNEKIQHNQPPIAGPAQCRFGSNAAYLVKAENRVCPLLSDAVEKGFWEGSPSNIDSKPISKRARSIQEIDCVDSIVACQRHAADFFNSIV